MNDKPEHITVVVVDDHALVRAGIIAAVEGGLPEIHVVGQAATVDEAKAVIARETPDVVLLDVHLPGGEGGGGPEVAAAFQGTGVRFLALSVSDSAQDVVSVIRAGARGYVTKSITPPKLLEAIARVAAGDAAFSPRLAGFVLDAFGAATAAPGPQQTDQETPAGVEAQPDLDCLTNREREVMRLIARGFTYREAATELFISIKTIETHVSAVLRKLQLSSRYELTRWAAKRDLL